MRTKVVINADDLGLCESVNSAVIRAHSQGVLTSATLMVNMDAAEQAVDMAKEAGSLGIGLHLNLLEGRAVSDDPCVRVLLDGEGQFRHSPMSLAIRSMLSGSVRRAIAVEAEAQICRFLKFGLKPVHIDSHKHVHMLPMVYKTVVRLARKYNFSSLRYCFEPCWFGKGDISGIEAKDFRRVRQVNASAKFCRYLDKSLLVNDYLCGVLHTGRCDELFWEQLCGVLSGKIVEVMVHPGYTEGLDRQKTRLIEQRVVELEALCSENVKRFLAQANVELVHYGMLGQGNE